MTEDGVTMWRQESTENKLVATCCLKKRGCTFKIAARSCPLDRWCVAAEESRYLHQHSDAFAIDKSSNGKLCSFLENGRTY
jgi:hypothetical protein